MPLSSAIALLEKEIAEKQAALAALKALYARGTPPIELPRGRGGKKPSIATAAIAILKAAGRPMHGQRELLPALEAQGIKIKHPAGLPTILLRTKRVERTSRGTYAFKGGDEPARR
jgi:hypothetical protein